MKGVFERLDTQHNPFVDTVLHALSDDPALFASITAVDWDGDKGDLLFMVEPVTDDEFEDLKDSAVELIRNAARAVKFSASCNTVKNQNVPSMVFKLTQKS